MESSRVTIKPAAAQGRFARLSPLPARAETPADSYLAGSAEIGLETPAPPAAAGRPGLGWQFAAGLLLAGAAASSLAGVSQPAGALEQAAPGSASLRDQGIQLLLNSPLAGSEWVPLQEGLARLKPAAREKLQGLPPELQHAFVNLGPEATRWMVERVHGKTWLAVIPVSHREAVVSGKALGLDVYERALAGLKKQVARGAIPAELEARLSDFLQRVKSLTPEQRSSLIEAMEAQVGAESPR